MGLTIILSSIFILIYVFSFLYEYGHKVLTKFEILEYLMYAILFIIVFMPIISFLITGFLRVTFNDYNNKITTTIVKKQKISDLKFKNEKDLFITTSYYIYNKEVSKNNYVLSKAKVDKCHIIYKDKIKKPYIKIYLFKIKDCYKFWFFNCAFVEKKEFYVPEKFKF